MADEYFKYESRRTRTEIATHLREIAAELDGDGPITFSSGDRRISVTPPHRPWFEIELEREYDEVEIEIELEWDPQKLDIDSGGQLTVESVDTEGEQGVASEEGGPTAHSAAFEWYEDNGGNWRFRLVHEGEILANSSGGSASREEVERTVETIQRVAADAEIIEE